MTHRLSLSVGALIGGLALWAMACSGDPISPVGRPCSKSDECGAEATCDVGAGVCVARSAHDGSTGHEASARPDKLMAGCWSGGSWHLGTEVSACGSGGASCVDCSTAVTCKAPACEAGACRLKDLPNGTDCGGGKKCLTGICQQAGCWSGQLWYDGKSADHCGSQGGPCINCAGKYCESDQCAVRVCQAQNVSGNSACGSSKCLRSTCGGGCGDYPIAEGACGCEAFCASP